MSLWSFFTSNTGKEIHKWSHYFDIYERHFAPYRNRPIRMLEIGVAGGGSLQMWRSFFHPDTVIVGIDITPGCKQHEFPSQNVHVRIGSQADTTFLQSVVDEFGPFDIVLDDGSHVSSHANISFDFLYPHVALNGMYMIEDMHCSYWSSHGGGVDHPGSTINKCKALIDRLNADYIENGLVRPDEFTKHTYSITFYDSVIVFHKTPNLVKKDMKFP
jgi:hypothetical protein